MKETQIKILKKVTLNQPVFIEGLPGLGLVGKLASEHLIKELKAEKFAELYSPDFPPYVMINKDATVKMRKNELYYWKAKKKNQKDIIILIGDDQGLTVQSQYAICGIILDLLEKHGSKMIYTLGGYGTGKISKDPKVFGAVNHKSLIKQFKKYKVNFEKVGGQIVGAAGLLIGLGALRDMKGICVMGETHGNYIDPKAAKKILEVVCNSLNVSISMKDLEKKAKDVQQMISKLDQMQKARQPGAAAYGVQSEDKPHLSYIR